jgi:hypothetical protein
VRRCASSVERPAAVARIHSFIHSFIHAFAAVTTFRDIFRDDATTRRTDAAPRYDPNEFVADAFAPTWAAMDFTRRFAASTLMIRMTKFRSREGESADGTGRTRGDDDDDDDARTRRVRTWRVKYRWCDYLNTSEIDVGSRVDV